MMFQLKVIWYLFNLCAIAFAWDAPGSAGFTTFAFSVEEQKLDYIPSAAPFINGSTFQPPLTSHPFESSSPVPEHLPSTPTVSPTQSAVAPSTKNPPSPGTSTKNEPASSAPPPTPQVPSHDLAPQKPTQAHAPQPVELLPHNETPSLPAVSPQARVPSAVPSHVAQPPVTASHVFAPPPLVSPPTSATTPPSTTSPAISPSISSLPTPFSFVPPPLPSKYASPPSIVAMPSLPSSVAPPPLPSKYASPPSIVAMPSLPSSVAPPPLPSKYAPPPSIAAMPSHTISALPPQTTPTHSKAPDHVASPSPLLEVMPFAVPSQEFGSPPAMPPKPRAPLQSSAPPPQVIPSDVTAPPHPSTPPITLPSPVLTPPPFKKSQVLASPPIYMPNISAPPPKSTISKHSSTQSPIPAPTLESNPSPLVLSPPPGAVPLHGLAPPPTHTPYIPAPPPNATISQHSSTQSPLPAPMHESNPPPIVLSPPRGALPSHDLAPPPTHTPDILAPPPNTPISQNSSAPLPPSTPTHESNPPPIVLSPPPGAVPSHDLAPPPTHTPDISAPPPNTAISQNSSAPFPPPTPTHPPPIVLSLPRGALPSHDLAPPPTHTPDILAPPPNTPISQNSSAPLRPTPTHESNPPPILLSPAPVAIQSHDLAPPPTHTPDILAPPPNPPISQNSSAPLPPSTPAHESNPPPIVLSPPPTHTPGISAPPPNTTISQNSSAPLPLPAPIHASNPPPYVMSPNVSSPPPAAAPSHNLASSPPPESHFSAPPPIVSSPLPPTPIHASNPPSNVISPIGSSPPPDAAQSHNVASSPPPESHFSAPPTNATSSQNSSAPLPFTPPTNATNTPPRSMSPAISLPPPDAAPSHDLAPSPPAESRFSGPPPSSKHNFSTPPTSFPTFKNASKSPSSSVPSHASAPSIAAEPPLTASPPSVHTLPSESSPPVTSNSSAPMGAPPGRSPSFDPVVPRESPSIPPEAQLPRVSSPAPSIDERGHQAPVHVAPTGPTHPLSPTSDHPEQGVSPSIAPSTHKSRGLPNVAPATAISPPISPTAEAVHSPSFPPLPSTNKTHFQRNSSHSAPETSYTVPASSPKQQDQVESPHSLLAPAPENTQRYHPPTSHNPGSSVDMAPSQSPSTENDISPVPVSAIPHPSGHSMTPFVSPVTIPSEPPTKEPNVELAPPILALPPPPPNHDCLSYTCLEPYTNTIPGSPCGCVFPMKVGLRIGVPLYTFFPLVPELAREIATGIFMKQSQVRIMGANAASEQPEKTILLIDLVPLGDKFDNITALLIYERFWNKRVAISKSLFGDYEVLYVKYPGLPSSPPTPPSDSADINGGDAGGNGSEQHPFGVDVTKKGRKHRLSGSLIAIIVFSAVGAVLLCLLLGWILLFRHRRQVNQSSEAPDVYPSSVARSTGPTGQSNGSRPSFSLSFESSVAAYTGSAKTFSASEIERATDNFNLSRVLGEGGFGRVYSGALEDGTEVAVKVLKREDQQGGREFLAEIEMLSRLHHRNLVKLIGICVEEHARCLVYELIHNGSVESHLHGIDKESSPLDWASRMKIALGSARGLAYLHEDSSPRVIHRDFKASNILLETDFTPKVSDFGLARTAMDEENRHISTRVMGTFGYVAPEYAMTGHLLVKSDVYSYGVVLLELLTGRKPVDMSQPPGQENLVAWTRPYLTTKEALKSIVDPNLGPDISFDNVAKVGAIASMCVQPEVSHRPFMGEVVQALKLVCNECDDAKDELGSSPRSENLCRDQDVEKALSQSDVFCETENGLGCKESGLGSRSRSGSFRRHSSSGPIGGGKSWMFWKRGRTTSSREEVVAENGLYRFWSGSH